MFEAALAQSTRDIQGGRVSGVSLQDDLPVMADQLFRKFSEDKKGTQRAFRFSHVLQTFRSHPNWQLSCAEWVSEHSKKQTRPIGRDRAKAIAKATQEAEKKSNATGTNTSIPVKGAEVFAFLTAQNDFNRRQQIFNQRQQLMDLMCRDISSLPTDYKAIFAQMIQSAKTELEELEAQRPVRY